MAEASVSLLLFQALKKVNAWIGNKKAFFYEVVL